MTDWMQDLWAQLLFAGGVVAWATRLEGRASQNTKELARLEERLAKQRQEDMSARSQDWARMEAAISEMRKDIKELLGRKA